MTKRFIIEAGVLFLAVAQLANAAATSVVNFAELPESRFNATEKANVEIVGQGDKAALLLSVNKPDNYPGVELKPAKDMWDLSDHSAVEFTVTNVGQTKARVHGRIDNPGDWRSTPWNVNAQTLSPGDTKTIRVTFGESYGNPTHQLDPTQVKQLLVFVEKPAGEVKVRIDKIQAVGKPATPAPAADPPAVEPQGDALIDVADPKAAERFGKSTDQIAITLSDDPDKPGLNVKIEKGPDGYPGIDLKPTKGGAWDLSDHGHVVMRVTNTSDTNFGINLRVDNPGDWKKSPWNTEGTWFKPGETKDIKVIFGYQHGKKKGYPLDPSKVTQVLIFTSKANKPLSYRLESLMVGGPAGETPPVDPKSIRIKPDDSYLIGGKVKPELDKQVKADDAVKVNLADDNALLFTLPADKDRHAIQLQPPVGRWDLRNATDVRVKLTNTGDVPVTAAVKVSNDAHHATDTIKTDAIAPGQSTEVVVPFAAATPWVGADEIKHAHQDGKRGTGSNFSSDKADAVRMHVSHAGAAELRVDSVRAVVTPIERPDWLGQRPPVEGDWKLTFDEDFKADQIDMTKWQIYGPNWWGARSKTHWTKDNLILEDDILTIRLSKDRGWHNDDPDSGHQSEYAGGFLETYGKWGQRYGYFESRMKLPDEPGLWPAFWLMPDRGPEAGPQWKRSSTEKGGMEFDIFEHLTRWGPYRYNIAMHWNGYGKNHLATGSQQIYFQPDEDGFITTGLLWLPGKAVFYCNGQVVARWEHDRISNVRSVMMFTMPIGGWDNNSIDGTTLPADWEIDYVRAWQRDDLASEVDGYFGGPDARRSDQNPE